MALVRYNGKNILYYNFKTAIMPGINELDAGVLDAMRQHKIFKHHFDEGRLVVVEEDPKVEKPLKDGKRAVQEMLKLIPEMFDKKLLEKIIKTDGRPAVISSAKEQLHKLTVQAEDEEKDKSKAKMKVENGVDESSNP